MNPLLQSIQEGLKQTFNPPQIAPPDISKPPEVTLPPSFKQGTDAAKTAGTAFLNVLNKAFEAIDYGVGTALQAPTQISYNLLAGGDQPLLTAVKATDIAGKAASTLLGEKARVPTEIAAGLFLPPFGAGSLLKVPKLADITKFSEEAAKLTEAGSIALRAEQSFPGLSKETALKLGEMFKGETDAKKIFSTLQQSLKGATRERGFITSVKETLPKVGAKIEGGRYTMRPTEPLAIAAKNLVRLNPIEAELRAVSQTGDDSIAIAAELLKRYDEQATKLARIGRTIESNALLDKAAELTTQVAKNLTNAGRYVQAASILARSTPEGIVRFVSKEIQKFNEEVATGKRFGKPLQGISGAERKQLMDEWNAIRKMDDPDKKAQAIDAFTKKISDRIPSPLINKVLAVWKAGLLTGVKTSGLNIMSNTGNFFAEIIKDIPAALIERTTHALTGGKFGAPTIGLTLRGFGSGAKEGFTKGLRYLKTGYSERNMLDKIDVRRVSMGTSQFAKAIQKYEETVFRVIGAEDMPFYYGMKTHSIISQATASGKSLGLKGKELDKYVNELIQNPTDEIIKYATYDAEVATFQNSTVLSKMSEFANRYPAIQFILPFIKTPSAVAMQVVNYSPLGLSKPAWRIIKGIRTGHFNQRLFAQEAGRSFTGTGALWLGGEMYKNGLISLTYPSSATERNQWELEGRIPNSINMDGNWRGVAVLGPQGILLLLGGQFAKAYEESGSVTEAMLQATASLGNTMTEQTFLKGTNELNEVLNDPYAHGVNYFGGFIGSVIPTIVSDIARAADTSERRIGEGSVGGLFDRLYARIPWVREQMLEPKITSLGAQKPTAEWWQTMFDPSRPSKASKEPVVLELRRLRDVGFNATPTKLGKGKKGYASLTPAQNTDLWVLAGTQLNKVLKQLIQAPEYDRMTDEQKQKVIQQFSDIARTRARASILASLTSGLSGGQLKLELKKHKDSGLLTEGVFKEYMRHNPQL